MLTLTLMKTGSKHGKNLIKNYTTEYLILKKTVKIMRTQLMSTLQILYKHYMTIQKLMAILQVLIPVTMNKDMITQRMIRKKIC